MRVAPLRFLGVFLLLLGCSPLATLAGAPPRDAALTFEDRVRYQRRIEAVYWNHRVWPDANPGPKPALDAVLPDALIRQRVGSYLDKSAALELIWSRPLTGEQLQAEMNRMVRNTKDPEMLRELFTALDNDPFLIAECLVRPVLADRLARNRYARDERFHGALRKRAEAALAAHANDTASMARLGGDDDETDWRLVPGELEDAGLDPKSRDDSMIDMSVQEWDERIGHLAALFGVARESDGDVAVSLLDRIPVGQSSRLVEQDDRFAVTMVLAKGADRLRIATVSWAKRPFDAWWAETRESVAAAAAVVSIPPPTTGYQVAEPIAGACVDDSWIELWYSPESRSLHTAVWTGAEMIVWGGGNEFGPSYLDSGGRYDPATDSWAQTSTGAGVPSPRLRHTAVWTGTEMIVWGGADATGLSNSGGRYDPMTDGWTATSTGAGVPAARQLHTAVWTGAEMIVWGGADASSVLDTGARYDPVTDGWTATSTAAGVPVARQLHSAVWTGAVMIVWGGDDGLDFFSTGGRYDPATDSWAATSTGTEPAGRSGHTAVWAGTVMVVWGGQDGVVSLNTGGRYDPGLDAWTPTSTDAPVPTGRSGHTAVFDGITMIVWGGGAAIGSVNTGARYDPASDAWVATSTDVGVPAPRRDHTAVWTGTEVIVWGGSNAAAVLNSGGRYDPATDGWTGTSTGAGVPVARRWHTAVWTGAEMIVWGGSGGDLPTRLNTGGRYDPAIDTWTPVSTATGVPRQRIGHTAVWTGTEMIVWGGFDAEYLNDGGRYDPLTDSWTATAIGTDNPFGRSSHTAVWTGTEMIVWGGYLGSDELRTGGRYDPATDSWTATLIGTCAQSPTVTCSSDLTCDAINPGDVCVVVAPTERGYHTAVWTGTEMVVWGGWDGVFLDTGGRYDPATDSWTSTSTGAGAPTARFLHGTVWTGTEMIVWGGSDGVDYLDTGGRYDPVGDSWSPTSTTGAATARNAHTAVWAGSEMIVWGGWDGGRLNSGGRYDPVADGWTPTSTVGAAMERNAHTAVWTGSEMIVWGGWNGNDLNNGGRYCAGATPTATMWYLDADGDGYGDDSTAVFAASPPAGYVALGGDCDDGLAGCTIDCTDRDADGLCVTHDCDDWNGECLDVCGTDVCIQGKVRQIMTVLPDLDQNNASELAVLHTDPATGDSFVHVKDASTGNPVGTITAFGPEWRASFLLRLSDHSGNGVPEIAIVATHRDAGQVRVLVKDAGTGDLLASVPFSASYPPLAVEIVPDFAGTIADEIAVLGVGTTSGNVLVRIKDGGSGANVGDLYFSRLYKPEEMVVIPDFGGTTASEIGILATREAPERVQVRIKDAGSGSKLGVIPFSTAYQPQDLFVVPDFADSPAAELAVLGIHQTTGQVLVRLKDASSEVKLNDVLYSSRYVPETCLPAGSFVNTPAPELVVVGIRDGNAGVLARFKDASSRETASEVDFSANYPPDAVVMVPDVGGSAADDIALLGTHVVTGDILVRVKDSATGELIAVIPVP